MRGQRQLVSFLSLFLVLQLLPVVSLAQTGA